MDRRDGGQGDTLLLVEKVTNDTSCSEWTAVDPDGHIQSISLRHNAIYQPRAVRGTRYRPAVQIRVADRQQYIDAAFKVVRRRALSVGPAPDTGSGVSVRLRRRPRARGLMKLLRGAGAFAGLARA